MQKYYKYQYRFNASHSFDYDREHEHMHTFTITVYISPTDSDKEFAFTDIDERMDVFLSYYEGKYLNDLPEFSQNSPTLECIGDCFYEKLSDKLKGIGIELHQLDIADHPTSTYQVSDRLHIPVCYIRELE